MYTHFHSVSGCADDTSAALSYTTCPSLSLGYLPAGDMRIGCLDVGKNKFNNTVRPKQVWIIDVNGNSN